VAFKFKLPILTERRYLKRDMSTW